MDSDTEVDDLLDQVTTPKKGAVVKKRSKASIAAQKKQDLAAANKANAQRLAQVVNLMISGHSLAEIGAAIGATEAEVDRMLQADMTRYVRSQPALRVFVRNYISGKYTGLLEAVWDEATDRDHPQKLENADRALRILNSMAKLHGAEAPTQTEIKVDAAPEAVERLVQSISAAQGLGYDVDIFDAEVVGEIVEDMKEATNEMIEVSGNQVGESDGDDEL